MKLVSVRKEAINTSEEKKARIMSLSGSKRNNANSSINSNSNSHMKNANYDSEGYDKNYGHLQAGVKYHSNISNNDDNKIMDSYTYNFHSNISQNNSRYQTNAQNPSRKDPVFSKIRGKLVPGKNEHSSRNKIKISLADRRLSNQYNTIK